MIVSYDITLVLLSISVAIIGSFTGLLIMARNGVFTRGPYKLRIAAGAIAIGSSIWSMHFIGMLALGLPVPVEYDGLITTISVFIAIVLTGLGLYAASSGHITRFALPVGGILMGGGIAGMHYMGMSAIRAACIVAYAPAGVVAAVLVGITVSTLSLWFTFTERGRWETVGGSVALGLAISSMHYIAMVATNFSVAGEVVALPGPALSQHNLAFIVAISTFLICGMFLVLALPDEKRTEPSLSDDVRPETVAVCGVQEMPSLKASPLRVPRIPVRRNHATFYADAETIISARADGHYSWIALCAEGSGAEEYFCEKSISSLAKILTPPQFVRSHRSYLVNIAHVNGFRRQGDGGLLLMDASEDYSVPVSRSHVREIQQLLEQHSGPPEPMAEQPAPA